MRKGSELKPFYLCIKRFFIKTACKFQRSLTRFSVGVGVELEKKDLQSDITIRGRFLWAPSVGRTGQHSVQGALSIFDLLLQSLLHGLILGLLKHVLHVSDGGPVARGVVKHSDGLVSA